MSFGDVMSLVAVVAIIFALAWCLDRDLREGYRAARAVGIPRIVAIPVAVVLALVSSC